MDITRLAVKDTLTLHLKDAEGNPLFDGDRAVTVTIHGPGSKVYARAQGAQNRRLVERMRSRGKGNVDVVADRAEFLADITDRFECLEYAGLQGRDLALAVYADPKIGFIAEQVNAEAGDWANFTQPSSTA